jgi:hypothetical protein
MEIECFFFYVGCYADRKRGEKAGIAGGLGGAEIVGIRAGS